MCDAAVCCATGMGYVSMSMCSCHRGDWELGIRSEELGIRNVCGRRFGLCEGKMPSLRDALAPVCSRFDWFDGAKIGGGGGGWCANLHFCEGKICGRI